MHAPGHRREPKSPRRSCSHRNKEEYKWPFLQHPRWRQKPGWQTPADPQPRRAKCFSRTGGEDWEKVTPRAAALHRGLPGSPEAGGVCSPYNQAGKTWKHLCPTPLTSPGGGKYALVQIGFACCWLQGFPGSQPVRDEERMGGGSCDVMHSEAPRQPTGGGETPPFLSNSLWMSTDPIPIPLDICTPQLLLPPRPQPLPHSKPSLKLYFCLFAFPDLLLVPDLTSAPFSRVLIIIAVLGLVIIPPLCFMGFPARLATRTG